MSGQQIGTVVGAVVGSFIPVIGTQLGAVIGGMIGGWIAPTQITGPKLTDGMAVTAQDGIANPWGFGTFPVGCNIIWTADIVEHEDTDDGKGSGQEVTTYRYTRSYAVGICRGNRVADGTYTPIAGILRATKNGKVVYDVSADAPSDMPAQNAKFLTNHTFYLGSEGQLPDPTIESYLGAGNAPAYPGQVYMVAEDDETSRGEVAQWEFVVATGGTASSVGRVYLAQVGTNAGIVRWSNDGDAFDETEDTGLGEDITSIFGAGEAVFVFAGRTKGRVKLSGNSDWVDVVGLVAGAGEVVAVAHSSDVWVFVYSTEDKISRSLDGINLSSATVPGRSRYCVAGRGNTFVAGGSNGNVTVTHNSGLSWDEYRPNPALTSLVSSVAATDSAFVISFASQNDIAVSTSGDEGEWDFYDHPFQGLTTNACTLGFRNGVVALNVQTNNAYSSDDGSTWTDIEQTTSSNGQSLIPTNSLGFFVGSGATSGGSVWRSADATAWTASTYEGGEVIIAAVDFTTPASPEGVALSTIVAECCNRSGLTSDDIDVSQLTDIVDGFKVASLNTTGESIIQSLMPGYFFDAYEADDKLRFVKRGGNPTFTLTIDDLAERDGDALEEIQAQEVELLRKVHVKTMDPAAGYVETTQTAERRTSTIAAKGEQTIQIPVVTDHDSAARMANKRMKVAWGEPRRFKYTLPYTRPDITPTDVGWITDRKGRVQMIRVEQASEDEGRIDTEASLNRQAAYTSNVSGVPALPPADTSPGIVGPTLGWVGNLPSLRTSDNVPGVYIGGRGYQRAWGGYALFLSADGGESYQRIGNYTQPTQIGNLTGDITASGEPIPVFMPQGTLSTITDTQMANRGNAFAITTDDESEIGQFQTATLGDPNEYNLTDTVRELLGTEAAEHDTGDPFVMLAGTHFVPLDISLAGKPLLFKFVSFGTSLDETEPYPFTFDPKFTSVTVEAYTDDAGNIYTDDADNTYYYETSA